jgi:hypothetical protein
MNNVERVRAILNFQPFDRLPIIEWASWWDKTITRWRGEGLPASAGDRWEIGRHFGLDMFRHDWARPRTPACPSEPSHGAGIIATEADYAKLQRHLYPLPAIDHEKWQAWKVEHDCGESAIWLQTEGFFWWPRVLLGIERHLFAFYDQPGLMRRINEDLARWTVKLLDEVCAICQPEFLCFSEDMSYNHGPMLSKGLFDEFIRPYYDIVMPHVKKRGLIAFVDSDGDVTQPVKWYQEAGLDGFLPLEKQSGLDVVKLRADNPRLRLLGAFDKMTMNRGRDAMEAEFQRLLPIARQGGLIIGCDHQTPPGVSYAQYQDYLELLRKYARLAGGGRPT